MVERVILVGFSYSGKSTVGWHLAARLGWEFIDFDKTIERTQNQRIAEIFREEGESHFRRLEAELTEQVEHRRSVVLAPGGGWVTQPDLFARLRPASLIVWLQVQPETVLRRHRRQTNGERPLLSADDPSEAIGSLLAARTPLYEQADVVVSTDGREAAEVAEEIAGMLPGPGA